MLISQWWYLKQYIFIHMICYHIISYHIISYHIISYHIISYHIISNFIPISYIKTNRHKNTTWYWGNDQKAIKAWEKSRFQQIYTETSKKYTLQNRQSTQKYTRHAPKWSQLYSDSKIDFSWFLKCLVVLQCFTVMSNEFQKDGPQFLIAQSENIFFILLIL